MDVITLIEYLIVLAIIIVGFRAVLKRIKAAPKQLKVYLRGQIAAIRDPVLLNYRTNPEVYGISDDVALSASILRTRVQIWKTIIFCIMSFLLGGLFLHGL
jgi:hypothetical protein